MPIVRFHRGKFDPFLEAAGAFLAANAQGSAQNAQLKAQQDFQGQQAMANAISGAVQNIAGGVTKGLLTKYEGDMELKKLVAAQALHQSGAMALEDRRTENDIRLERFKKTGFETTDTQTEALFAQYGGGRGEARTAAPAPEPTFMPGEFGMSVPATGESLTFPRQGGPLNAAPQGVPMSPGGPMLTPSPGEVGVFVTPGGQRVQQNTQAAGTELAKLVENRRLVQVSTRHSDAEKADVLAGLDARIANAKAGWMPAPPRVPGIKDLQQADQIGTVEVPGYGTMFIAPKGMSARPLKETGGKSDLPWSNIADPDVRHQAEDQHFADHTREDKHGNLWSLESGNWKMVHAAPVDKGEPKRSTWSQARSEAVKELTVKDETPPSADKIDARTREIMRTEQGGQSDVEISTQRKQYNQRMSFLRKAIEDAMTQYPGGPETMPENRQRAYKSWLDEYAGLGGT